MKSQCLLAVSFLFSVFGSTTDGYQLFNRWTRTATDGFITAPTQGEPTTLTWGFIADGVLTSANPGLPGFGPPSNLISQYDARFGAGPGGPDLTQRPWFTHFAESFERFNQLAGLNYIYESNDDGAGQSNSNRGITGLRADVRIGGRNIDGPFGILGFNNFPQYGDMVLDTTEPDVTNASNDYRFLRNLVMHEHGHGTGLAHVESSSRPFLMEPFISVAFDGHQFDDILGLQRHYGDVYEKDNGGDGNDIAANATPLGTIAGGSTVSLGVDGARNTQILRSYTDFISIDDNSDTDFLSFTITQPSTVDITVDPVGQTYFQGPQGGSQTRFVASQQSDLSLALFDTDGTTLLDSQNSAGIGGTESITGFSLTQAGTYFARVQGAQNEIQMYQLDVSAMATSSVTGDFNNDGFWDCTDINMLSDAIATGSPMVAMFDMNGDGALTRDDITDAGDGWLAVGGANSTMTGGSPFLDGDADLSGNVDETDFAEWNASKFTANTAYCLGNFNADLVTDGRDFNVWNGNNGQSSAAAAVVPEPAFSLLLTVAGVCLASARRMLSRR